MAYKSITDRNPAIFFGNDKRVRVKPRHREVCGDQVPFGDEGSDLGQWSGSFVHVLGKNDKLRTAG